MPASLFTPPFEIARPDDDALPLVLSSPHSGRHYPKSFIGASRLDAKQLRMSEDCFVEELFGAGVKFGAHMLAANFPRAYLDVNREPYELDPAMFDGPLPDFVNASSGRVAGGLGTIARLVSETDEIYDGKISFAEAEARIDALYKPYHAALDKRVDEAFAKFGTVLLIDCHSMPSTDRYRRGAARPDFVLGDRHGKSCAPQITDYFERALARLGFTITRNKPYAGGYITEKHGRPDERRHALQIEVNRALYIDEDTLAKHSGFSDIRAGIERIFEDLAADWRPLLGAYEAAAE